MQACMQACKHASMYACMHGSMFAFLHTWLHIFFPHLTWWCTQTRWFYYTLPGRNEESDSKRMISKQACWHACIFPCMHSCMEICMHASMLAYLSCSSYYISFRALHQHVLTGARRGWYASKHSGMHGFFLACMHAEKLPCMPACLLSYHPLFTPCNMQRGTMSCVHVVGSSLGLRSGG